MCAIQQRVQVRGGLHAVLRAVASFTPPSTGAVIYADFAVACHGWCDPTGTESTRPSSVSAGVLRLRRAGRVVRRAERLRARRAFLATTPSATIRRRRAGDPVPAESGTVHTVTEAVRAAVGAAAQVAAAVGVLSGRRSDGNSSLALSRANAWLPNHAGNERPYWWSLAPEPGSDLSHDCPARGRGPGDDSGGRPPLGHSYIRVACTTGGARRPTRRPVR